MPFTAFRPLLGKTGFKLGRDYVHRIMTLQRIVLVNHITRLTKSSQIGTKLVNLKHIIMSATKNHKIIVINSNILKKTSNANAVKIQLIKIFKEKQIDHLIYINITYI